MRILIILLLLLFIVSRPIISFAQDPKDVDIALTISGEAIGEGRVGMYAVACAIQNRAKKANLSPYIITKEGFYGKGNKWAKKGFKLEKKWLLNLVDSLNRLELVDITNGALFFESIDYPKNIARFDKLYTRCWSYKKHIFYK